MSLRSVAAQVRTVCGKYLAGEVFGLDGPKKQWQADLLTLIFLKQEITTLPSAKYFHNCGEVRTGNHQRIVRVFVYHE